MKLRYQVLIILLLLPSAVATAPTDPFVGKWVLNTHQSKYPPGACPKNMVIEMESAGKGIHYRSDTTYGNGGTAHAEYTADYDGRQALVIGTRGLLLPVSLKRIGLHTVIASYTKAFEVVATSRRVVSRDGRKMTITTISRDQSGKRATAVAVYEKDTENKVELRSARPRNAR